MDDTSGQGQTPLMTAAEKGNTKLFEVLIENKVNVHLKDQNGYTALHVAAKHDQAAVI